MRLTLRRAAILILVMLLCIPAGSLPASATCGGGGGGGRGGMAPPPPSMPPMTMGGSPEPMPRESTVYRVPWSYLSAGTKPPEGLLVLYWFHPASNKANEGDFQTSRYLTLTAAQCVGMALVMDDNTDLIRKYAVPDNETLFVLASGDGTQVARLPAEKGKIKVGAVEKMVRTQIDKLEAEAKQTLGKAKDKADGKDTEAAVSLYTQVWDERCLMPDTAKKAAKALQELGKPVRQAELSPLDAPLPDLSEPHGSKVLRTMTAGLAAELDGRFLEAQRLYTAARKLDPADPVPACYLGELLRHQIGDWDGARSQFTQLLAMRADPVSRAAALHGLGKMTIHDGDFQKGLELFQESLEAWPLPVTYRNLAVYWRSEKENTKALEYVRKAVELDPDDEYNQVFAATYLVELGKPEEAEQVAERHEKDLADSYNLAVIYAQLGNKAKSLELLRRHFYVYEQFAAVRAKEMQEARDDIAFVRYHEDPDFIQLTSLADTDTTSYHRH